MGASSNFSVDRAIQYGETRVGVLTAGKLKYCSTTFAAAPPDCASFLVKWKSRKPYAPTASRTANVARYLGDGLTNLLRSGWPRSMPKRQNNTKLTSEKK